MNRSRSSAVIGVAIGVVTVVAVIVSGHPGWGVLSHSECVIDDRLGNVTVWLPAAVVSAPYLGSESGLVAAWGESPLGVFTASQITSVLDGNVTAYYVGYTNWTVFTQSSELKPGPGANASCSGPLMAFFSPNPAMGLRSGGISYWPLYSHLVSEVGLPMGLNGSQLCSAVEETSYGSCAVGGQFDINFEKATGTVDTCGVNQPQVVRLASQEWPVTAPFIWNDQSFSVPLNLTGMNGVGWSNGTFAFYNYTFPANGGVWQYDDLSETSSTGAGLVFSYASCPTY